MFCPIWTSLDMFVQLSGRKRFFDREPANDPYIMKVDDDDDVESFSKISSDMMEYDNSNKFKHDQT